MRQEALICLMDGLHMQDVEDVSSGVCIVQMQRSYIDDRQNANIALLRFFQLLMYLMLGLTIFSLKWIVNDFPGLRSVVLLITQAFTASISMWRMAMRKIEKYFQCTE